MDRQVCLFLVYQRENNDYDTYDSAVVAAYTIDEAKDIHPSNNHEESVTQMTAMAKDDTDGYMYELSSWAEIQHIKADYIGIADIHITAGEIICSSFNAG